MNKEPAPTSAPNEKILRLEVEIESDDERAALEQALLRARAAELTEVRRRDVRLVAGYGDATTRDAMTAEGRAAKLRHTMLDRVLGALRKDASPRDR
jgi:hypothetical protein